MTDERAGPAPGESGAPQGPRLPSVPRIALGLLAGWAAVTLLAATAAAAVIAAVTPDPYSAQQQSVFAAVAFAAVLMIFAILAGPAVFALLLRAGRRGWGAFLLAGIVAGAVLGAVAPLAMGDAFNTASVGVLAAAGGLQMLISRAASGVRRG